MRDILFRAMWFVVGCIVSDITFSSIPQNECNATAADLWLKNSYVLGAVGVVIIAISFWEGWKEKKTGSARNE
jgi:hypothetical protein